MSLLVELFAHLKFTATRKESIMDIRRSERNSASANSVFELRAKLLDFGPGVTEAQDGLDTRGVSGRGLDVLLIGRGVDYRESMCD